MSIQETAAKWLLFTPAEILNLLTRCRTWLMVTTSGWRLMLVEKVVTYGANYHVNTMLPPHGNFKGTKIKNKDASGLFELLIVYRLTA